MLADLVVDVNVMLHANNPQEPRQAESEKLLRKLLACQASLCVDDGFSIIEARNRSKIGHEYLSNLNSGMLAYAVIVHLAGSGRIKPLKASAPRQVSKLIRLNVPKVSDRTYVAVAYNSSDKTLASHDFQDFTKATRKKLKKEIGVTVGRASEVSQVL